MKYSELLRMPHFRMLSVVFGALTGAPLLFFAPWQLALLAGAVVTLLASFILPFMAYKEERAYQKLKNTIASPHLLDERVSFTVRGGSIGGHMILTDKKLILLSLEKGEHRLELDQKEVKRIVASDENRSLTIYISNTQFVRVFSLSFDKTCQVLAENGWDIA